MSRVLLDTNVILDALLNRKGLCEASKEVLKISAEMRLTAYIAVSSLKDIYYISHRAGLDKRQAKNVIGILTGTYFMLDQNSKDVYQALLSDTLDLEDAILEESAIRNEIDYIITRNIKDFKNDRIKAITPEQVLETIDSICNF